MQIFTRSKKQSKNYWLSFRNKIDLMMAGEIKLTKNIQSESKVIFEKLFTT